MKRRDVVRQAGAIPYMDTPQGPMVLLVSLTNGGWGVPKGGIKKGHSPQQTATYETLEEAGVLGRLEEAIGRVGVRKQGRRHQVTLFPMRIERVLDRWSEEETRIRVWVPIAEAPRLITRKGLAQLVVKLRHRLLTERPPSIRLAA